MGSSISISKIPDQGTILTKTQTTVYVMNHILEFILKNADISDIVSLASDEGCRKWVIIAESKIKEVFKQYDILKKPGIQLPTDKDKQGSIYVQKLKELEKSTQSDLKSNYCKVLAFYYIRLFQIVGALALSIQDSTLPIKDYIGTRSEGKPVEKLTPTNPLMPKKKSIFSFSGGSLKGYEFMDSYLEVKDISNDEYYFLPIKEKTYDYDEKKYVDKPRSKLETLLVREDKQMNKYTFKNTASFVTFDFTRKGNLIKIDNVFKSGTQLSNTKIKKQSTIQTDNSLRIDDTRQDLYDFIIDVFKSITGLSQSNTINILKELRYLDDKYQNDDTISRIRGTTITINKRELKNPNPTFIYAIEKVINGEKETIDFNFNIIFNKSKDFYSISIKDLHTTSKLFTIPEDIKKSIEDRVTNFRLDNNYTMKPISNSESDLDPDELKSNKQDIPTFLQKKFDKLTNIVIQNIELGIGKLKEGYQQPIIDTKVDNQLKYTELWSKLSSDSPVKSFCVARALQLLNLSGLSQNIPDDIRPLVYDTKFELIENKSLPMPSEPITSIISFKALNNLYTNPETLIETITKEPKLYLPEDSTRQTSLKKLIESFGQTGDSLSAVLEESGSLDTPILNKKEDSGKISVLREKAKTLFQKQFDHTKEVLKLLKKIFDINGSNITLNRTLASQGIRGLESVAQEARDLLSGYYAGCQITYAEGVKELRKPKPKNITMKNSNKNKPII
jgi:hypothetical protein